MDSLVKDVIGKIKPKVIGGVALTGKNLVELIGSYVQSLNC